MSTPLVVIASTVTQYILLFSRPKSMKTGTLSHPSRIPLSRVVPCEGCDGETSSGTFYVSQLRVGPERVAAEEPGM